MSNFFEALGKRIEFKGDVIKTKNAIKVAFQQCPSARILLSEGLQQCNKEGLFSKVDSSHISSQIDSYADVDRKCQLDEFKKEVYLLRGPEKKATDTEEMNKILEALFASCETFAVKECEIKAAIPLLQNSKKEPLFPQYDPLAIEPVPFTRDPFFAVNAESSTECSKKEIVSTDGTSDNDKDDCNKEEYVEYKDFKTRFYRWNRWAKYEYGLHKLFREIQDVEFRRKKKLGTLSSVETKQAIQVPKHLLHHHIVKSKIFDAKHRFWKTEFYRELQEEEMDENARQKMYDDKKAEQQKVQGLIAPLKPADGPTISWSEVHSRLLDLYNSSSSSDSLSYLENTPQISVNYHVRSSSMSQSRANFNASSINRKETPESVIGVDDNHTNKKTTTLDQIKKEKVHKEEEEEDDVSIIEDHSDKIMHPITESVKEKEKCPPKISNNDLVCADTITSINKASILVPEFDITFALFCLKMKETSLVLFIPKSNIMQQDMFITNEMKMKLEVREENVNSSRQLVTCSYSSSNETHLIFTCVLGVESFMNSNIQIRCELYDQKEFKVAESNFCKTMFAPLSDIFDTTTSSSSDTSASSSYRVTSDSQSATVQGIMALPLAVANIIEQAAEFFVSVQKIQENVSTPSDIIKDMRARLDAATTTSKTQISSTFATIKQQTSELVELPTKISSSRSVPTSHYRSASINGKILPNQTMILRPRPIGHNAHKL